MKKIVSLFLGAALLTLLPAFDAFAYRCGNKVISQGDAKFYVSMTCGEPDYVEHSVIKVYGALFPRYCYKKPHPTGSVARYKQAYKKRHKPHADGCLRYGNTPVYVEREIPVELWIYVDGNSIHTLHFRDSVVSKIEFSRK